MTRASLTGLAAPENVARAAEQRRNSQQRFDAGERVAVCLWHETKHREPAVVVGMSQSMFCAVVSVEVRGKVLRLDAARVKRAAS
jgi:hypothetical protein